jgi:hypothetical protein
MRFHADEASKPLQGEQEISKSAFGGLANAKHHM